MIIERRGTSFDPIVSDTFVSIVQNLRAMPLQDVSSPYAFSLRMPRLV
jgi:hypothetical protein